MTVKYLVNIADAQLYFDEQFRRCKGADVGAGGTLYFTRVPRDGGLLMRANWDSGLAAFTEGQRRTAQLWAHVEEAEPVEVSYPEWHTLLASRWKPGSR